MYFLPFLRWLILMHKATPAHNIYPWASTRGKI
jgi:hypothetical protein